MNWKDGLPLGDGGMLVREIEVCTGTFGVRKTIPSFSAEDASLMEEVQNLKVIEHENIVSLLDFEHSALNLTLHVEYVPFGSILEFLDENEWTLQDMPWAPVVRGITRAFDFLHTQSTPIVHGNFRGACILMGMGEYGEMIPKLTEYWSHLEEKCQQGQLPRLRNLRWRAPELLHAEAVSTTMSDVWSFGCTLIEIFSRTPPWGKQASIANVWTMLQDKSIVPTIPQAVPASLHATIRSCLQRKPSARPIMAQLVDVEFAMCEEKEYRGYRESFSDFRADSDSNIRSPEFEMDDLMQESWKARMRDIMLQSQPSTDDPDFSSCKETSMTSETDGNFGSDTSFQDPVISPTLLPKKRRSLPKGPEVSLQGLCKANKTISLQSLPDSASMGIASLDSLPGLTPLSRRVLPPLSNRPLPLGAGGQNQTL